MGGGGGLRKILCDGERGGDKTKALLYERDW